MSQRANYVVHETLISVAINTVLSIGFVFLVFRGQSRIAASGAHGIIVDMVPQTFMVTLMSCLIPGLLTRSRHVKGSLPWNLNINPAPLRHVFVRAITVALVVTCVVVAMCWGAFPHLLASGVGFLPLLVAKASFGAALSAVVTPWAVFKTLGYRRLEPA